MFFRCSKTTQRNKQIAMGRKKFNMDPKKVTICCGWSLIWESRIRLAHRLSGASGDPVPAGERPPPEHAGGHRAVPLQRRGAQQDRHRGLLRRTVRALFRWLSLPPRCACTPMRPGGPGKWVRLYGAACQREVLPGEQRRRRVALMEGEISGIRPTKQGVCAAGLS